MYEDQIKRLRDIASHDSNIESNYIGLTLLQAADAIEAMNCELKSLYKLLGTHPDPRGENGEAGVKCMVLSKKENTTRWIPVTERLPKENGRYLVRYVRDIGLADGVHSDEVRIMRFADAQWRFPFICNPDVRELVTMEKVTHWMPLPETPKEETT